MSLRTDPNQPIVYQIKLKGRLNSDWTEWFEGMAITLEGEDVTILCGPVADRAALYGLLKKARDLGLPLLSVNRVQITQGIGSKDERPVETDESDEVLQNHRR